VRYQIHSRTGADLGEHEGETPAEAVEAMRRAMLAALDDAGFATGEAMAAVLRTTGEALDARGTA